MYKVAQSWMVCVIPAMLQPHMTHYMSTRKKRLLNIYALNMSFFRVHMGGNVCMHMLEGGL